MTTLITGYDSAAPQNIPKGAQCVLGEIDESYAWAARWWTAFRDARKFRISLLANVLADVFDFENGSAPLFDVRNAVAERASVYLPSVLYCDIANLETAEQKLINLPVAWWIAWPWGQGKPANFDPLEVKLAELGISHIKPVGWQHTWNGNLYDESLIDIEAWPNFNGKG